MKKKSYEMWAIIHEDPVYINEDTTKIERHVSMVFDDRHYAKEVAKEVKSEHRTTEVKKVIVTEV